jgi:hypothetical protein
LYVIPLSMSRKECGPGESQTQCLLNIISPPGPSCPSGPPLYCFRLHASKTNAEIQQLGMVDIGSVAYALFSSGWVGGESSINIALVPVGPARTQSAQAR